MPDRPPLDPAAFLREHVAPRVRRRVDEVRAKIARLESELEERLAVQATVELGLEGDGGGVWYLNLAGGEMTVDEYPARPPVVRIRQSRADWDALAIEAGPQPSGRDLTRARVERVGRLEGGIEFLLGSDDGTRRILVHFGPGEPAAPRCTVSLRADVAQSLQRGELSPQAAFLQGLVSLQGDVAFAMQAAAALMA
jgi:hypothetical protein